MSTRCFACLIQLMPLDGAIPEPPGLSPELKARRIRDKDFLEQLFNPKTIKDYKIPVPVSAELRSYQQVSSKTIRNHTQYNGVRDLLLTCHNPHLRALNNRCLLFKKSKV